MATDLKRADMPRLIHELNRTTDEVQRSFGELSADQLNWKPNPNEWSIGQCLEHLIITNMLYFPEIEQILNGTKQTTFWEKLPVFPKLFGSFVLNSLRPNQRFPAPKIFRPANSMISDQIVAAFRAHQAQLLSLMQASNDLAIERIMITSPVAVWMTYSLADAYRIMVAHEQHHLLQSRHLLELPDFPG